MRENQRRVQKINDAILKTPYIFYFVLIFLAYIALNLLINQVYAILPVLAGFSTRFLIPYLSFNFLIIPFLIALTVNLSIMKFKEARLVGKHRGKFAFLGVFGGILGGACPGCFVGLFPALLGLFGITATLSSLPLFGLELQIIAAVFLIAAIILLTRDLVCEVPIKKDR